VERPRECDPYIVSIWKWFDFDRLCNEKNSPLILNAPHHQREGVLPNYSHPHRLIDCVWPRCLVLQVDR